jgi:hypothetical protein
MPIEDPPDIDLEIYRKIWTVLEGYAPWEAAFEEGNKIRYDIDESNADPEKMHKADGDYPEAKLEQTGGSSTGRLGTDQTFGSFDVDNPCPEWTEAQTHAYRMTVTTTKLTMLEQSPLRTLTLNALRLAGPKLGLEYVTKVAWRWSVERRAANEEEGEDPTYRQVITIDISVESETEGPRLTGAR